MLGLTVFIPTIFVLWVCGLLIACLWYSTSRHSPWARGLLRRRLLKRLPAEAAPLLLVRHEASRAARCWFLGNYVLQLIGIAALAGCFAGLLTGRPELLLRSAEVFCCVGLLWSGGALVEFCRPALAETRKSCSRLMLVTDAGAGAQSFTMLAVALLEPLPGVPAATGTVVQMHPAEPGPSAETEWPQAA